MNDLKTVVRYFEMRWEGKTDFEALAMCDRREMERTAGCPDELCAENAPTGAESEQNNESES